MRRAKRTLVLRLSAACLLVSGLGLPGRAGHGNVTAAAQSDQLARPELVLQVGHSGSINSMALSSDGRFLISGGSDATIKLWEIGTGNVLRTFAGHAQAVLAVALSGDGKWIASGGEDSSVRVWNVMTGEMSTLGTHRGSVRDVAFSTDSRRLTSVSAIEVKQWDLATGRALRSAQLPSNDAMTMAANEMGTAAAASTDGRLVAIGGGISLGFGGIHARPILIVDATTGREIRSIKMNDDRPYVTDVRFSPDGRLLAATATNLTGRTGTAAVVVYDATTGRELKTLATTAFTGGVQFSPDGKILASRSGPNFDAALTRLANPNSAAGSASLSGSMKLLDVGTWREIRELPNTGYNQPNGVGLSASPLSFSADGRLLALTVGSTVALFDTANGSRVKLLRTTAKAAAISARPMGQTLAESRRKAGLDPDELRPGSESSRERLIDDTSKTISAINFSHDGRWLSSLDDLSDWDTSSGTPRRRVSRLIGRMLENTGGDMFAGGGNASGAASPDGKLSANYEVDALGGKESRIVVRDVASGDVVHTIVIGKYKSTVELPKALGKSAIQAMQALGEDAFAMPIPVRFAFGERGIVTLYCGRIDRGPDDCHVKTFDPATGKTLADRQFKLDKNSMSGSGPPLVLTADGRFLVSTALGGLKTGKPIIGGLPGLKTNPYDMLASYSIKIADAASGRQVAEFKVETRLLQSREGPHLAFSPGGHTVAVESVEKKRAVINLFDLAGRRKFAAIDAEPRPIESMTLSWDDKRVAVRYSDPNRVNGRSKSNPGSEVVVYDVASGRRVATLVHDGPVEGVTFSPTSQIIATLAQDGSKVLWDAQTGEKLAMLVEVDASATPWAGSDWLVVTPDGLFDGSAAAWQQIMWRFSRNTFDVGPVEMFFNDFFYPGLAAEIFAGRRPQVPRNLRQVDRRPPTLRVVPAAVDVSARMLGVRVEVADAPADATHPQGAGARDVRLFRNGTLVKVWHGDVLNGQPRRTLDVTLPIVAGENQLTAYAFNRDNVKSLDASAVVTGRESLARKGTAYVLAVGVNHYENSQYDLKYAGADATAFADEVQKQQVALDRFERVEVIQLLDQNATKANLLLALRRLSTSTGTGLPPGAPAILTKLQQAQPEDAVIIYFAGHGTAQGARFFLVPHDLGYAGARTRVDAQSVETILSHSISDLELESALEELDAGDLILVIDACNSGQALEAEEKRRGPMNSKGLAQLAYEKGLHILAAAQSYQAAMEASQLGHGYLTFALIEEGLKNEKADGEEQDGVITVREWFDYAARRVPQMQQNGVDGRLLLEDTAAAPDAARVMNFQQPRAFYRPETDVQPVIIGGKSKMPFQPQP